MDKHEAVECPAGVDALVWRHRKYTGGLRNMAHAGMVLVSLLFVMLAAGMLPRCIPAPVAAPAAAEGETMLQSVSVVWTVSLLVCSYFCFWIYTFSHTMGAAAVFFRVSYGVMLAYTAARNQLQPQPKMTLDLTSQLPRVTCHFQECHGALNHPCSLYLESSLIIAGYCTSYVISNR